MDEITAKEAIENNLRIMRKGETYAPKGLGYYDPLPGDNATEKVIWLCLQLQWKQTLISSVLKLSKSKVNRICKKLLKYL